MTLQPVPQFPRPKLARRNGFVTAVILLLCALLAPWIAPADPAAQNLPARLALLRSCTGWAPMNLAATFFRARFSERVSLVVSVSVVCGCGLVGLTLGMLAGHLGGWFDGLINLLGDAWRDWLDPHTRAQLEVAQLSR